MAKHAKPRRKKPTRKSRATRFVPVEGCLLCVQGLRKRHDHIIREPAAEPPPAPPPPAERTAPEDGLTPRERRFVLEYLVDLNATQAAIRAGYSARTARQIASENLTKPDIKAVVDAALEERARRVEVKADDVLRELLRVGLADPARLIGEDGRLLLLGDMPEDVRRAVASIEVEELFEGRGEDREHIGTLRKVKLWNKNEALRDLGRHLKLFTDVNENRHDFGPIQEAYERLKREVESRAGSGSPPADRS
jgi:phage terminase small subunit